jgi:poly-gamma-glutamate synthesis protein (capsule biosynthesis protein)
MKSEGKLLHLLLIILPIAFLISCATQASIKPQDKPQEKSQEKSQDAIASEAETIAKAETETKPETEIEPAVEPEVIAPVPDFITIAAVGDNLFHDPMIKPNKDGIFDFTSFYTEIKPIVEKADIAFVNQETVFGGKELGFSGYPRFNTPKEAGEALMAAGFDVVNHATNHAMDKGEKAVFSTMDFWDTHPEIVYLGIHRSAEHQKRQVIVEKNNIKTGFLSYTYGTNGLPVPQSKPFLVSLIDTGIMAKEIDALRPNCDLLVVSMHWGIEYRQSPNAEQQQLAQFLADHKVDIIIGHHPHVLEGSGTLTGKTGNTTFCIYSLGNFISSRSKQLIKSGELSESGASKSIYSIVFMPDAKSSSTLCGYIFSPTL